MADITVQELKSRRDAGENLFVIDVREPHEYEEYNIGGKLIPLGSLPENLAQLEPMRDQEIVIHCRSGARSNSAKLFLEDEGFSNVRNMLGGILAWRDAFES